VTVLVDYSRCVSLFPLSELDYRDCAEISNWINLFNCFTGASAGTIPEKQRSIALFVPET